MIKEEQTMDFPQWSHCVECGEYNSSLDFHGVCKACRDYFRKEDEKMQANCNHAYRIEILRHAICRECGKDFGAWDIDPF